MIEYNSDISDENLETLLSLGQPPSQRLPSRRRSPSPEATPPLPLVACELDIIVNGRSGAAFDKRNFDLNVSYEDFLDRLDNIVATKKKMLLEDIQSYRQPLRYLWLRQSQASGNTRNLPKPNVIEDKENFDALVSTLCNTAKTKPDLENMVLRIFIELHMTDTTDDAGRRSGNASFVQHRIGSRLVSCYGNYY